MSKNGRLLKSVRHADYSDIVRVCLKIMGVDGGPGSGNFGHAGRPGKVGGSQKGGGSSFRTKTSSGSYIGVQRAKAFNGIKKLARHYTSADDFYHNLDKDQRDMISNQYRQSGSKEGVRSYVERLLHVMRSQKPEKKVPFKIVEGKNITDNAEWDFKGYTEPMYGQKVDTEIEHVIVQQGFNGPPRVVPQEEFLGIIKDHPEMPVLFRSYAAIGEEGIQEYDDMLENGEWYIDCSNGGAQYGQGMYCAGVYGSDNYSGAASEMEHYRHVAMQRVRAQWCPELNDDEDRIHVDGKSVVFRQADFKKIEDAKPPEVQDVVAMIGGRWNVETVKGYFMPEDPEDDESPLEFSYYTDVDGHKTIPADQVKYWGPISRVETAPDAYASTRMMTLDPSARIIELSDLDHQYRGGFSKEQKREMYRERLANMPDAFNKAASEEGRIIAEYGCKVGLDLYTPEDEDRYQAAAKGMDVDEREYYLNIGENVSRQIYGDVDLLEAENRRATEKTRRKFHNIGSYAAALGYDAINAGGHGLTNSYTVVLNRTKLIINQSRVEM